jgi:hypothetical protein
MCRHAQKGRPELLATMLDLLSWIGTDNDLDPTSDIRATKLRDRVLSQTVGFGIVLRNTDGVQLSAEALRKRAGRRQRMRTKRRPIERHEHMAVAHRETIGPRCLPDADLHAAGYPTCRRHGRSSFRTGRLYTSRH